MLNSVKYYRIVFVLAIFSALVFLHTTSSGLLRLTQSFERTIRIDTRPVPDEESFVEEIKQELPYLPIEDLVDPQYISRNLHPSCAPYASLADVRIHNEYWQEFQNQNYSYYIFGAYLDNRKTVVKSEPVVRVLLMMNFLGKNYEDYPLTYCQLWYKEQRQPVITAMKDMHKLWYYDWAKGTEHSTDFRYAHFVNCPLPQNHSDWIPKSVSLVAKPCDKATNNVRVTYQPLFPSESKKEFAVCHKALDYPGLDQSYRFVEYFETLKILGAEKITMYHYAVHPNTTKVLDYYKETGFLEYRQMTLSMKVSNFEAYRHLEIKRNFWSSVLHELIHYNDCFYRNMYKYKYIVAVDNDEIIMPLGNLASWHELADLAEARKYENCAKFASLCFQCVYFPRYSGKPRYSTDIPSYFYMLQHVSRVRRHLGPEWATKCFHSTDLVIATHNHFPIQWTSDACKSYSFEETVAQLNHYREPDIKDTLSDPVLDLSLWRFKDDIIKRSTKVLEELKFLSDD